MSALHDIRNINDIKMLVDSFYTKIREDELLGPIFNERIADRWETHLQTMYQFWDNLLFGNNTYHGRPFPPHATMPIDLEHFERWLMIFASNIDEHFEGPKADEARFRATNIANVFYHKINTMRGGHDPHAL
jgi:hemoglobin